MGGRRSRGKMQKEVSKECNKDNKGGGGGGEEKERKKERKIKKIKEEHRPTAGCTCSGRIIIGTLTVAIHYSKEM